MVSLLLSGVMFLNGTLVPAGFCEGKRFDGQLYPTFIEKHALTEAEAAKLSDPVLREIARREASDRWGKQVRRGQTAKCGKTSF